MSKFSAAPQAIGYIYQCVYALFLLLDSPEENELSLESLDDIQFSETGTATELLQLKHHSTNASLTNSSVDLWKTIRVWSVNLRDGEINLPGVILTLVTTATAPESSIAALLRPSKNRNTEEAHKKFLQVMQASKNNKSLQGSFDAFRSLSSAQQKTLVNAIKILDNSPDISDTAEEIKIKLRLAVRRPHINLMYERLLGWWLDKSVRMLSKNLGEFVNGFEVLDKVRDIAEQFQPDSLPIDYFGAEPPVPPNPDADKRRFVRQLKEIAINHRRIENAILDYYRAFEQRSRWAREDLLVGDELKDYEAKLIDEWERRFLAVQDEITSADNASEEELQKIGKKIFNWVELDADIRIRPQVTEAYVMRGSYHLLADQNPPCVWWHPKFLERLEDILPM